MADAAGSHAEHDPELIASLLDGDLAGPELAKAQLMVFACRECAALHADLLALSIATRAQAAPGRSRDFRLTAADAARLRAEPEAQSARLTDVKTDLPATSRHASHDTALVASLADHSLVPAERTAGEELVASCTECATLHADLALLVAATRAMPTPPRPISYTLTRGQAARLRPNPWRRLVAATGTARDGFTRPLAIGLTALGLVGLMVSSMPPIGFGGAASSAAASEAPPAIEAAPAPGGGGLTDTTGQTDPGAAAAPGSGDTSIAAPSGDDRLGGSLAPVFGITSGEGNPAASAAAAADGAGKGAAGGAAEPSPQNETTAELTVSAPVSEVNLLPIVSVALLFVGLGLFILRWGARRFGA